jgi:hypothetical protein
MFAGVEKFSAFFNLHHFFNLRLRSLDVPRQGDLVDDYHVIDLKTGRGSG